MADIRFKDLTTTASSTASDDFIAVDGTTNGTRKLSAFSPTFGGNATVTGNLTVNTALSVTNGISANEATFTGGYAILRGYGGSADAGSLFLGQSSNSNAILSTSTKIYTAIAGAEISNNVAAGFRVLTTTASTTTSSGALVVGNGTSGGLGVGGNITLGGGVNIAGAASDPLPAGTSGIWTLSGSGLRINSAGVTFASLTGTTLGTATLTVNGTTSSTTTSSGALVVSGGVGIGGSLNAGANNAANSITGGDAGSGTSILQLKDGLGSVKVNFKGNGDVAVQSSTASTSTSSGALVVSGGVGVAGKVTSTALGLANTSQSISAWGDIGPQLSIAGAVVTDTTSSGTVSRAVANSINATAFAASSSTTYTQAVSLFIADAPTANTNVTITHRYAIYTAGGRINFQGLPTSSAGLQAGTLWNDGGTLKVA